MKNFGIVTIALLLLAGVFLAMAFVLMLLVNIVLEYYGAKELSYGVSVAITAILVLFGGALVGGSKS